MPDARLTQEDRQRIADGLAARLDHAEIASRLGRPSPLARVSSGR